MPQPYEDSAQPYSAPALWVRGLSMILTVTVAAFTLLTLTCLTAQWVLSFLMPLTPMDLSFASWVVAAPADGTAPVIVALFAATTAMYLGLNGRTLALLLALVATGISFDNNAPSLRSAILHGEAKVGCFDYKSTECLSAIGKVFEMLPAEKATDAHDQSNTQTDIAMTGLIAIARAPFDLVRASELQNLLNAQRAELAGFLREHSGAIVPKK